MKKFMAHFISWINNNCFLKVIKVYIAWVWFQVRIIEERKALELKLLSSNNTAMLKFGFLLWMKKTSGCVFTGI